MKIIQNVPMQPDLLPPPSGSRWEPGLAGGWRLARFPLEWREAVRSSTALRSLEIGCSSWHLLTESPSLAFSGRWTIRKPELRLLEVVVDGQVVSTQQFGDSGPARTRLELYGDAGPGRHQVDIYLPIDMQMEIESIEIESGATFTRVEPGLRWLSWGDSITQGAISPSARGSYVQRVAARLGWTAINRGFGGAGCPDPMTALAIAKNDPWDLLTIAIGVNSAALGLDSPEEFGRMYALCLELLTAHHPDKSIVCLSPIHCAKARHDNGVPVGSRTNAYRSVISELAMRNASPNVHFVDGLTLLAEPELLVDEVHPGSEGHAQVADRLAPILFQLVKESG